MNKSIRHSPEELRSLISTVTSSNRENERGWASGKSVPGSWVSGLSNARSMDWISHERTSSPEPSTTGFVLRLLILFDSLKSNLCFPCPMVNRRATINSVYTAWSRGSEDNRRIKRAKIASTKSKNQSQYWMIGANFLVTSQIDGGMYLHHADSKERKNWNLKFTPWHLRNTIVSFLAGWQIDLEVGVLESTFRTTRAICPLSSWWHNIK